MYPTLRHFVKLIRARKKSFFAAGYRYLRALRGGQGSQLSSNSEKAFTRQPLDDTHVIPCFKCSTPIEDPRVVTVREDGGPPFTVWMCPPCAATPGAFER